MVVTIDTRQVRRAQRGDPRALDAVVCAVAPYVGRICGAIALQAGDDAMQEAMIAIVRNLRSLRSPAALQGWARRIAVREALRACQAHRAAALDPSTLESLPAIPSEAMAVEIRDVLASLAPEHRAVLVLRHLHGLGEDEMAELLGVATGTVKSRLHRARQSFRARWER